MRVIAGAPGRSRVGDPDLARVVQAEHEAAPGRVDQPDHLGARAVVAIGRRDVGDRRQRARVEDLDAAGLVVRDRDQPAVLRDGAADALPAWTIRRAIAAASRSTLVSPPSRPKTKAKRPSRLNTAEACERSPRPVDAAEARAAGGLDHLHAARRALDHDAEIAGAAQHASPPAAAARRRQQDQAASASARIIGQSLLAGCPTSQAASAALISDAQGGIGVPGRRARIVVGQRSRRPCRPASAGRMAGPRPPFERHAVAGAAVLAQADAAAPPAAPRRLRPARRRAPGAAIDRRPALAPLSHGRAADRGLRRRRPAGDQARPWPRPPGR